MKIFEADGNLAVILTKDVTERLRFKKGEEVEWVYDPETRELHLIKAEHWAVYNDLSELSDAELYKKYKEGKIKLWGWTAGYTLKRIEAYVERTKAKVIERELRSGGS